ncbi:hypothetical protein EG329_004731 [Mollisiaceae sp. DMI_Dod_QoI]|nr:hypothetical protein EG329_004731 [Helotiales sp. DMI_Dod_QoI]
MDSMSNLLAKRGLSLDTRVNLIIGILTIVIGILSAILAWATWRLTDDRQRRRSTRHRQSPEPESIPLQVPPPPPTPLGVEFAFRIGRSR